MSWVKQFHGSTWLTRGGRRIFEHYAGETGGGADFTPCSALTRFRIASVSKQFNAAAVMLLAQQGRLAPNSPLSRWFPGGPPGWEDIELHHLLSHSSGLGHWKHYPALDLTSPIEDDELLEALRSQPLLSAPGNTFSYSSPVGRDLLERHAEVPPAGDAGSPG